MRQGGKMIGRDYDMVAKPISETIQLFEQNIIGIGEDFRLAGQQLGRMVMARIAGSDPFVLQMLEEPQV